jgi:hypothetical protein
VPTSNPKFWALIGFGVGAVIASAGSLSTPLDSILGGLIQALIWFGVSKLILRSKSKSGALIQSKNKMPNQVIQANADGFVPVKLCDQCSKQVPFDYPYCALCQGTKFTLKKILPGEVVSTESADLLPDTKICDYCAEEIKFLAIKCKHCGSALE